MVFKTAYLILGNAEEADDALQEVFIKVHRSWKTYDPKKGALSTWLRRITVNQCISERRRKPSGSVSLEKLGEQGFDPPDDERHRPEETVMRQEESGRVGQAIGALDAKQRAVIVLRYGEGLSYDEIARILEIPLGTVKSRLNTAVRDLRKELMGGGTGA
jgi:RNA polymerase sigma-70 factor (ECF subfamily)